MNTLFDKVVGENEKCVFYFYLKTEGTFWRTQYITEKSTFRQIKKISFHLILQPMSEEYKILFLILSARVYENTRLRNLVSPR